SESCAIAGGGTRRRVTDPPVFGPGTTPSSSTVTASVRPNFMFSLPSYGSCRQTPHEQHRLPMRTMRMQRSEIGALLLQTAYQPVSSGAAARVQNLQRDSLVQTSDNVPLGFTLPVLRPHAPHGIAV